MTDAASGADFDVTFIEHGVKTPALNNELLDLMESSARGLKAYNQSLAQWMVTNGGTSTNLPMATSVYDLRHAAFA